jgi:hypothetical protein
MIGSKLLSSLNNRSPAECEGEIHQNAGGQAA